MKESLSGLRCSRIRSQTSKVLELFETHVEPGLVQPTFITDFPKPISPLSKASPANPQRGGTFRVVHRGHGDREWVF